MAGIKIPISIDNANFTAAAHEAKTAVKSVSGEVRGLEKDTNSATDSMKEMLKQAAAFGGISLGLAGAKEFVSQIVDVRKEMQGYQTSLNVLLGDQAKANAMFSELKDFAVTTPLMFKDLASGAQTMLGFNIEAEKVVPTLKAIGDISMGDAGKFQSLTLAFSQMSATGKLMGQDLLQMINAGFNPLTEISRKTGKSIGDLKEEMSAGSISAEMVADAFMSATQEGGKFYGMLEKQGQGLAGKLNTLQGAIDDMFNNLGQQSEGVINSAVEGATNLVKNYEAVGKAIMDITVAYGSYKGALMAVSAIQGANFTAYETSVATIQKNIDTYREAIAVQTDSIGEAIQEIAAKNELNAATLARVETMHQEISAQDELFASNVRAQAAQGQLTNAQAEQLITMQKSASQSLQMLEIDKEIAAQTLETASKRVDAAKKVAQGIESDIAMYDRLISENEMLGNAEQANLYTEKLQAAMAQQKAATNELEAATKAQETAQENYNTLAKNANTLAMERQNIAQLASIKSMGLMQAAGVQLRNIMLSLNAAIDANPLMILAAAVAAVGFAVYKGLDYMGAFNEKLMTQQDIQDKLAESTEKLTKEQEDQRKEAERLLGVLRNSSSTDTEKILAYEELKKKCAILTEQYSIEELAVIDLAKAYKTLKEAQEKQSAGQMIMDTQRMERVISDLEKVRAKQARSSSAETQKYLKENGLVGQSTENIINALKERIAANQELIDAQKKASSETAQVTVKNKKYWEDQKKESQAALDALSSAEAAGKKGQALKRTIAAAEAEIAKFNASSSSKNAIKNNKQETKRQDLDRKLTTEAEKAAREMARKTAQAEIDAMKEGSDKTLKQIDLNYQNQLDEIENWYDEIKQKKIERAREIWKVENPNTTLQFDENTVNTEYTAEEVAAKNAMEAAAVAVHEKAVAEIAQIDNQYRLEYLAEYGTFEQQKAAISDQYAQQISDAQYEWQKAGLERQKQAALEALEAQSKMASLQGSATYTTAMVDPAALSMKQIDELNEKLEAARKELSNLPPDQLKVITDLMHELDTAAMEKDPFSVLKQSIQEIDEAKLERINAGIELKNAQDNLSMMEKVVKDEKKIVEAKEKLKKASDKYENAVQKEIKAEKKAKDAKEKVAGKIHELGTAMKNLGATIGGETGQILDFMGSCLTFATTVKQNVDMMMEVMQATAEGVSATMRAVTNAVAILAIIQAAWDILMKCAEMFGLAKDDSEYEATKEKYESLVEVWDDLIDKKKEYLDVSWGNEIAQIREEAQALEKQKQNAAAELARQRLKAGASAGSHTYGYRMNRDLEKYFRNVGISDISDLTRKSGEELEKIRENNVMFWAQLDSDFKDYLEDIIEGTQNIKDLQTAAQEQYAGFGFDALKDEFMDMLMDMENGASAMSENLSDKFMETMLRQSFGKQYEDELKRWYESYAEAVEDGNGQLTEAEMQKFQGWWDEIAQKAVETRDEIAKMTGYAVPSNFEYTFNDIRDGFIDLVADMETTSEDFSEHFSELMYNAIVNAKLKEEYSKQINDWYDTFRNAASTDTLDETAIAELRATYAEITESMRQEAQQIADLTGYAQKTLEEKTSNVNFETVKSNFTSLISDMKSKSQDFANSFKQMMYEAMVNMQIETIYSARLEKWYSDFAKFIERGANTEEKEYTKLMETYEQISDEASEMAKQIAEMLGMATDTVQQKLTMISFEQVQSGFTSLINGMTMSAEDFTENFKKMMYQAVITSHIEKAFSKQLDELSERMQKFIEEGGDVSSEEYGDLLNGYVAIGNEAAKYAQGVADKMGYTVQKAQEVVQQAKEEIEDKKFDFDYIKDGFSSLLSDMSADAEAFGKKFNEVMFESLLDKQITTKFEGRLQAWYNDFDRFLENNGNVNSDAYRDLLNRYQALGEEAANAAHALADAIGLSTEDMLDKLTQTSYQSVRDNFQNLLMDMSSDSQTFAEDFTSMLQSALINAQMTDLLDDELKTWYKQFGEVMNDGKLTDTEIADLRASYNNIVQDALDRRDAIANITGYGQIKTTSQGGGSSAFQGMSQDTGNELNGRFTALQIAGESVAASMIEYITQMRSLVAVSIEQNQAVQEIRNMMVYTNSYLDDILKYAKLCHSTLSQKLGNISSNTKNL